MPAAEDITVVDGKGSAVAAAPFGVTSNAGVTVVMAQEGEAGNPPVPEKRESVYAAPAPDPTAAAPKKGGAGYLVCKRAFDIVFSAGICVLVAIPVAVASAAIAIESPGKPFFRQERIGQYGKPIRIFKLRSMVADAHTNPQKYMTPEQYAVWKREQKLEDDPRITKVGRVLRRTSLDELPQFLNVLNGDMSVIGPRPVTLAETFEFGDDRDEVLSVRPGITGLWQSTDRNDATWVNGRRQKLELEYVRNQGFAMDTRCFFGTFGAMFGKNKTGR